MMCFSVIAFKACFKDYDAENGMRKFQLVPEVAI